MDAYKKDMAAEDVAKSLSAINDLAQNIRVNGVPTLIVNSKKVHAYDAEAIQKVIDDAK